MASPLDIRNDAPGLLRTEAMGMTLKFERTSPTTGRVSWNIPRPATGCAADTQAYNGIVVTFDTTSNTTSKLPKNGTIYSADPTVDQNLFAGDTIGTSKVVGAFYNDLETTFFDITGLKENMPCYVSGFPVDAQNRYYREGIHAYSLDYRQDGTHASKGTQVVVINQNASDNGGVLPGDATGLDPATEYTFEIQRGLVPKPNRPVNSQECVPVPWKYTITVDGASAATYGELLDVINAQLQTVDNPPQGPTPPNTNAYYYDAKAKKLYAWDGSQHVEAAVIIQPVAPDQISDGVYWYNPDTLVLNRRSNGVWEQVVTIRSPITPSEPPCGSYWFNGTTAYTWSGVVWETHATYIQDTDPSLYKPAPCGSFWYNTQTYELSAWNDALQMWTSTNAVQYGTAPNQLTGGEFWYNTATNKLHTWDAVTQSWVLEQFARVSETEPTVGIVPGTLWYNPTSMTVRKRSDQNDGWQVFDVMVYNSDPTLEANWWNTDQDNMYVWDAASLTWNIVTHLYQQPTDPTDPPNFAEGDAWYNTAAGTLMYWRNACFVPASYVVWQTDPRTSVPDGTAWFNTTNALWYVKNGQLWELIDPTQSPTDPAALPAGTLWLDPASKSLQLWNGVAWVSLMYSTKPLTPTTGAQWYDTTVGRLKQWDGYNWTFATPLITAEFNCYNNIIFTDTSSGSLSWVSVTDVDLFESLDANVVYGQAIPGSDGVSAEPLYDEIGIGTDGTNDERNNLMTEIRYALGYPTVNVEVTPEQLNLAIDMALQTLRANSSIAYSRGFFFLQIHSESQRYLLTNKVSGMNRIVDVLGVHRLTSAFLSSAHGAGVYGQIVMQHLYNMGTFDLLSYHIMSEYTKTLEILFAGRVTYTWNEQTRELHLHHRYPFSERMVLVDASVERTEQQLISDRICRPWLRKWATAEVMLMLANTRGKFATLPGAGGGVSLNASELRQQASTDKEQCMQEIFDFVVDSPEEWGIQGTFTFG